jgi:hypothetical protein
MSVFSLALRTLEERASEDSRSWQEQFAALGGAPSDSVKPPCLGAPAPPPAAAPAPCSCCCGPADDLDKSFVVDPTLSATNACGYAVFQGLPSPSDFWAAVVAARCSAVVVLGHGAQHSPLRRTLNLAAGAASLAAACAGTARPADVGPN